MYYSNGSGNEHEGSSAYGGRQLQTGKVITEAEITTTTTTTTTTTATSTTTTTTTTTTTK